MLKIGNTSISKAYLGSTEITRAYLGSTLVFDNTGEEAGYNVANLIAYYRADGNGNDEKGAHNATVTSLGYTTGKSGSAFAFTGSASNEVKIPNNEAFSFTNGTNDLPFTISMYVQFNSTGNMILGGKRENGSVVEYDIVYSGGKLYFELYTSGSVYIIREASFTPTAGIWYHLVFAYNGDHSPTGMTIYSNASDISSGTDSAGIYTGMVTTTSPVFIGKSASENIFVPNCSIDGVGYWNKELTQTEVTAIYAKQNAGLELL